TKKMTKQTVMPEPSIEPKSSNENLDLKNDNPTEISDDAISNENIQPNDDIESNDEVESNDNKNTENEAETNDSLQDTSSTEVPQSSEDDMPTNDDNSKQSHKKAFILILLSLVIAAAGYMVGYLHLFDFDFRKVLKTSEATSVKTNKVGSDKAKDSETQKNVTKDTLQANLTQTNIPPEANDYPQIADGKYYIVGIKTYRKIKSDYNIKRYCLQIYGNTEILPYVLLINNIDNPDNVAVGKIIKFPILVTK
ncbi:MAG: hypothetical protein ACI4TR_05270, partial [Bacteroidaceae bacterium]